MGCYGGFQRPRSIWSLWLLLAGDSWAKYHAQKNDEGNKKGEDFIAALSVQTWSIYFSNARVASLFLSKERLEKFSSGAHRFSPRVDVMPSNAKAGIAPPSARWQEALFPKSLHHTSRGPAVNRYIAFLMPPDMALRKMDNWKELWIKTHDRRVLPIIVADEFCEPMFGRDLFSENRMERWHRPVLRNYWDDSVMSSELRYLPLGPRHEFRHIQEHEIRQPSERKYLLSMMVSLSTSKKRLALQEHLQELARNHERRPQSSDSNLPQTFSDVFIWNAIEWQNNLPDSLEPGKLVPTDKYREILLDSVFSVAPSGHNPETFRIFEAAEAGSIPVVDYTDRAGACVNPWKPFKDSGAPFIWVEDWTNIAHLLPLDTAEVSALQEKLLKWYTAFMKRSFAVLENSLRQHLALSLIEHQDHMLFGTTSDSKDVVMEDGAMLTPKPPSDLAQLVAAVNKGNGRKRKMLNTSVLEGQKAALRSHVTREAVRHQSFRESPEEMIREKLRLVEGFRPSRRLSRYDQHIESRRTLRGGELATFGADLPSAPIVPLVTGCGRSGTHTVAELLNTLGIPAIHEGAARSSVSVSWFYAPQGSVEGFRGKTLSDNAGNMVRFKAVDKRQPSLYQTGVRFLPVIHITRNPLTHIEATSRCICARGTDLGHPKAVLWDKVSWQYAGQFINLGRSTGMERSAKYWLHWNELCENSASYHFRIEDLNPRQLVEALGMSSRVHGGSESIPTFLSIRSSATNATRTELNWEKLNSEVGNQLTVKIASAAHRYGYES